MFTATLIALSWHRPSTDFLSLRSRPASLGSRTYFSFVLCFELFVSKPSRFLLMRKPSINFSQVSISSFFTLRLHRAPAVRLIDSSISRSNTPNTSTPSRPLRSPPPSHPATTTTTMTTTSTRRSLDPPELLDSLLPLLSPDPAAHTARKRTRLRSSLAQTSNLQPAISESIIRTRTHAAIAIAR